MGLNLIIDREKIGEKTLNFELRTTLMEQLKCADFISFDLRLNTEFLFLAFSFPLILSLEFRFPNFLVLGLINASEIRTP